MDFWRTIHNQNIKKINTISENDTVPLNAQNMENILAIYKILQIVIF